MELQRHVDFLDLLEAIVKVVFVFVREILLLFLSRSTIE
jgi:hypothetical protein